MLTVEMMAAAYGDALWIEYGSRSEPRVIAIDGGAQTGVDSPLLARLRARTAGGAKLRLELLVVTHVDADHINGALAALTSLPAGVRVGDVWFNGFKHLVPKDQLGPETGEQLSRLLVKKGLPWNERLGGGAVVVPASGPLPSFDVCGLQLTVLSPTPEKLARLHKVWKSVVKNAGVATDALGYIPADEQETLTASAADLLGHADAWPPDVGALAARAPKLDASEANGSSIGLLAEWQEGSTRHAMLLGADSHAPVLDASIARLNAARGTERLRVDAFKLPHHGSRHNLTNDLLRRLTCRQYLVSTNGDKFSHPDHEALARVLVEGGPEPRLCFNYKTRFNDGWAHPPAGAPGYRAEWGDGALRVTLS
jgi:hypothetical protein